MAVDTPHARFVVAEPLGLQHVGNLVFVHPHLQPVPLAMRGQALDDRYPRRNGQVFARDLAGTGTPVSVALVRDHQAVEAPRE